MSTASSDATSIGDAIFSFKVQQQQLTTGMVLQVLLQLIAILVVIDLKKSAET